MTVPVLGTSDFQSPSNAVSNEVPINTGITSPHVGFTDVYNGVAPSYTHALLSFTDTALFGQLRIQFTSFNALGITYVDNTFVYSGGGYNILIPVRGAGMHVQVGNVSAVGGGFWQGQMVGCNAGTPEYRWPNGVNKIDTGGLNYNAGTSQTFQLPFVQPGPAQFTYNSSSSSGSIFAVLRTLDNGGNAQGQIAEFVPLNNNNNNQIILPAEPIQVAVFNQSAAAATIAIRLDALGGWY